MAVVAILSAAVLLVLLPSPVLGESRADIEKEIREIELEVAGLEQNFLRGAILESDNRFAARMNDGQFFFYSADCRFILKTCSKREAAFLMAALPNYHAHLMENRFTLLCRFFGLHRVTPRSGKRIIALSNVPLPPSKLLTEQKNDITAATRARTHSLRAVLTNVQPESLRAKIDELIDDIFRDRLNDGQLDMAALTLSDLAVIKESFAKTLRSMMHTRIEYPKIEEGAEKPKSKTKAKTKKLIEQKKQESASAG